MRSCLVSVAILLAACRSPPPDAPAPSRSSAPGATPSSESDAVRAPPSEIAACTLGTSQRVVGARRRPEITVGASHVALAHRSTSAVSILNHQCEPSRAVHTGALPLAANGLTAMSVKAPCTGDEHMVADRGMTGWYAEDATIHADVARIEGDVYVLRCDSVPPERTAENRRARIRCVVDRVGGGLVEAIVVDNRGGFFEGIRFGFAAWRSGESDVFALALARTTEADGVYAVIARGSDRFHTGNLGRPPDRVDLDDPRQFAMTMTRSSDGGFVFEHGETSSARRVRSSLGHNGESLGASTSTIGTPPAEPELDIVVVRRAAQLRLHRSEIALPIDGLSSTNATRDPDFVRVGQRVVVVYSEGTGRATRIRAAVVDPATARVVGDVLDVSSAGREAGSATIDAFGENAAIAWDEKVDDTWEVRLAEVRCR